MYIAKVSLVSYNTDIDTDILKFINLFPSTAVKCLLVSHLSLGHMTRNYALSRLKLYSAVIKSELKSTKTLVYHSNKVLVFRSILPFVV